MLFRLFVLLAICAAPGQAVPVHIRVGPVVGSGVSADGTHHVATPHAALALLRTLKGQYGLDNGAVVTLSSGTYRLAETLAVGPELSGTPERPTVLRAESKGSVTLFGSAVISGWTPWRAGIWKARLPGDLPVGQLYFHGQRQTLARVPDRDPERPRTGGLLYVIAPDRDDPRTKFHYDRSLLDPSLWLNPTAARVVIWPGPNWNCGHRQVTSVDLEQGVLAIQRPRYDLRRGNRFYIENVLEELDAPGEWYADRANRLLYFKPPTQSPPGDAVTIPVATSLITIEGHPKSGNPARGIVVQGLRLRECRGTAIILSGTSECVVRTCEIMHTGDAAVVVRDAGTNNRIAGCDISETGLEGIRVEGVRDMTHSLDGRINGNVVTNNHIHHIGVSGNAGGGIDVRPYCGGNVTHDNVFSNNLVHDTPRKGIMFGGIRNTVEFNEVHHTNLEQSDTGAVGMCTRDLDERGSIIRFNFIHDTGGYNMLKPGEWQYPSYCWGIYLDDWTSGVTVFGNIVARTYLAAIHVHSGLDNVIENNIFVDGKLAQIQFSPITEKTVDGRLWRMSGNRVLRNICMYSGDESMWLRGTHEWYDGVAESDGNLVWAHGREVRIERRGKDPMSLEEWRGRGFDRSTQVADPLFADPAHDDYSLADASPAFALGFKPIPTSRIGLLNTPERFSWPVIDSCEREVPVLSHPLTSLAVRVTRADVVGTTNTVVLDGEALPAEWAGAAKIVLARDHRDSPAKPHSTAKLQWDNRFLYAAIDNVLAAGKPLRGGTEWGKSDAVELAVRARPDGPILILHGYTDNTLRAVTIGGMSAEEARRAGDTAVYAAHVYSPSHWSAEIQVPWDLIPGVTAGTLPAELQFNLTCRKTAENLWIMWRPTGRKSYGVGPEGLLTIVTP